MAIARSLFTNPRIPIFDKATSALDYESEAIIQQNMASICADRTVIIIAHRLSAVRQANRIAVMDKPTPLRDFLRRYSSVFSAAWQQRKQLDGTPRQADELAFYPPP